MKRPNAAIEKHRIAGESGRTEGAFRIRRGPVVLNVIASFGHGWDHVSVSTTLRCPTWEEMDFVKRLFFDDRECVMQLHPPRAEWVNCHPYCLHLWRPQQAAIPQPPQWMVGPNGATLNRREIKP